MNINIILEKLFVREWILHEIIYYKNQ